MIGETHTVHGFISMCSEHDHCPEIGAVEPVEDLKTVVCRKPSETLFPGLLGRAGLGFKKRTSCGKVLANFRTRMGLTGYEM